MPGERKRIERAIDCMICNIKMFPLMQQISLSRYLFQYLPKKIMITKENISSESISEPKGGVHYDLQYDLSVRAELL